MPNDARALLAVATRCSMGEPYHQNESVTPTHHTTKGDIMPDLDLTGIDPADLLRLQAIADTFKPSTVVAETGVPRWRALIDECDTDDVGDPVKFTLAGLLDVANSGADALESNLAWIAAIAREMSGSQIRLDRYGPADEPSAWALMRAWANNSGSVAPTTDDWRWLAHEAAHWLATLTGEKDT